MRVRKPKIPIEVQGFMNRFRPELNETEHINGITFCLLAENGTIDEVTATEHLDVFEVWGPNIKYTAGNLRKHNGVLYKCIQNHISQDDWTPDVAVSLWVVAGDPAEEWPAWSQPIGAMDAYMAGDKCSHNEKHWISNTDNNVWEPGVYGWDETD